MKKVNVSIEEKLIKGEGKLLFTVTFVDVEDSEDTTTQLWRADSEEELEDELKLDFYGVETQEEAEEFEENLMGPLWDDEYGITILVNQIGKIN